MNKIIKIGNGQGFWGDSIDAPIKLAQHGEINYLTLDYLAEVSMSIMQKQKSGTIINISTLYLAY